MADLTVGYAAMLEQFGPREAVELTALAEQQGQSSFVWNVHTTVGERTSGDLGPGVMPKLTR